MNQQQALQQIEQAHKIIRQVLAGHWDIPTEVYQALLQVSADLDFVETEIAPR